MRKARLNDWLVECDSCAKVIYASDAMKRWDGFIVCKDDYEVRHAQDTPPVIGQDKQSVPFSRPRHTQTELDERPFDPDTYPQTQLPS